MQLVNGKKKVMCPSVMDLFIFGECYKHAFVCILLLRINFSCVDFFSSFFLWVVLDFWWGWQVFLGGGFFEKKIFCLLESVCCTISKGIFFFGGRVGSVVFLCLLAPCWGPPLGECGGGGRMCSIACGAPTAAGLGVTFLAELCSFLAGEGALALLSLGLID